MKKFQICVLILSIFLLSGCATYQYQGNNLPPLSSTSFPSFGPVSEIVDGVQFKLVEGSGRTNVSLNMVQLVGQQSRSYINTSGYMQWNTFLRNGVLGNNYSMNLIYDEIGKHKRALSVKCESTYEMRTKEAKLNFREFFIDGKDSLSQMTVQKANEFKDSFLREFIEDIKNWGKTVKTGDILRYTKNELSNMQLVSDKDIHEQLPEIVLGITTYQNRKVVVTETKVDENIFRPELIVHFRGKGYKLYDAETFVYLKAEMVVYMSFFSPKEGTVNAKMDVRADTTDIVVDKILDPPSIKN